MPQLTSWEVFSNIAFEENYRKGRRTLGEEAIACSHELRLAHLIDQVCAGHKTEVSDSILCGSCPMDLA